MKCAYPQRIKSELVNLLPLRKFEGPISLVETPEQLDEAISELRKESVLGFDTETRPSFKKGMQHGVAILQLASEKKAWIFRLIPLKEHVCRLYKEILSNPDIKKVGLAVNGDIRALKKLCDFTPAGFDEISRYTQKIGIINTGMKNLCGALLGVKISKSAQLSNWEIEVLTQKQLDYAATDAWIGLELYNEALKVLRENRYCLYIESDPDALAEKTLMTRFKAAFKKLFG